MKVFYSNYTLTPLKRANRLSSLEVRQGVHLKAVLGEKVLFADYFPHVSLGDRSCDEFLTQFKFQDHDYDRKVFHFLLKDHELQRIVPELFHNHQLWESNEIPLGPVLKYKLQHLEDYSFMPLLENKLRVRLDANGLFNREQYLTFIKGIPRDLQAFIDYVEDPLHEADWSNLPLPSGKDFIEGNTYTHFIYKPNCEFKPKIESKIIYSSYLGSDLGRWHSYCELKESGDLKERHGLYTPRFYQEQIEFFMGSYEIGFIPQKNIVQKVYQEVSKHEWKVLCSM